LKGTVKIQENFGGDVLINGKKRTIHVACICQGQFEATIHIDAESLTRHVRSKGVQSFSLCASKLEETTQTHNKKLTSA
jgi:hypothetical protein